MNILSIGSMNGVSNTCVHRHWAIEKLAEQVDGVNMSEKSVSLWFRIANRLFNYGLPIRLPDISSCNEKILKLVRKNIYDIIWIDKGWLVNKETLEEIKRLHPAIKIVSYSPDNMVLRHNQSQNYLECIPLYDVHITTKSYILNDLMALGAQKVMFTNKSYESSFHYMRQLGEEERQNLGADIGFIGAWERERADSILFLTKNGINVRVFGGGKWLQYKNQFPNLIIEEKGLYTDDYAKALQAFKISLCFLRKMNYDLQTSRSMEIPACGGFMLAERTEEHLELFEEGKEAEFFSSNEELLEKCRYYLDHEAERKQVAEAGTARCHHSGYDNETTIKNLVNQVLSK